METKKLPLSMVYEDRYNPRVISDANFQKLIDSILAFPKMLSLRPVVIDGEHNSLGGNMRLRSLNSISQMTYDAIKKRLSGIKDYQVKKDDERKKIRSYWKEWLKKPFVEVADAAGLTEDERKQFMIKDNVSVGDWDWQELMTNWDAAQLETWGLDTQLPNFGETPAGFDEPTEASGKEELQKKYSHKLGKVIYEPKQTSHKICELFEDNSKKFDELIGKIENKELRYMLSLRAAWFVDFNFEKIADYYAYQATAEEQKVIEALGLVLLDYDGLIENGFSDLLKDFDNEENHE